MANKFEMLGYKIFEGEMRERLKPHLLDIKTNRGDDEYISSIRNCVAGCRAKWRTMPKVG